MFGPSEEKKAISGGTKETAGFLGSLLSGGPQAIGSFLGATHGLLGNAGGDLAQLISGGGFNAGQQVIGAAQPVFQRNLQTSLAQNQAQAANPFSTAFQQQNVDVTSRALQDFNLFQAQQLQQGQQTAINAANVLSSLARAEAAGPLGVLQLATNFFNPGNQQRGSGGLGGLLGGLGGMAAGSFLGPLGAAAGSKVGSSIFGE